MKKGIVISLAISHKNMNHIFKAGDVVSENDVNNFDNLVKQNHIRVDVDAKKDKPKVSDTEEPKVVEKKQKSESK